MPRTVLSLSSDILREVRGQATYYEARQALANALNFIDSQCNWEFLHKETNFNVQAPYYTGTVAVTANTTAVTGAGTGWSTGWKYRTIKFADRQLPYAVASFGSGTTLTLASALSGDTNISAGTYRIYQARYALPTDCEPGRDLFIRGPRNTGRNGHIPKRGKLAFDTLSNPYFQSGPPYCYSDGEYDETDNVATIVLYPYPTVAGEYYLHYYKKLTVPTADAARIIIPEAFETAVIKLAAAEVKQRQSQQGWLALQQQGQEMIRGLFLRFGASAAYENVAGGYEEPPDMIASDSILRTY